MSSIAGSIRSRMDLAIYIEPLFTAEVRRNIPLYMNHEEIVTHLRQEELLTDKEVRRAFLNHSIGQ